ncbi:MAG: anthranilate phosphoribosyltransferase [Sulfobacillus sp.]
MIQEQLAKLVKGESLTAQEAEAAMTSIMTGETSQAQTGAFLAALATKGETVEEVTGCARAMRRQATTARVERRPLIDTAGTGGDGSQTFNISTAAAFVLAGAGLAVAKHGNRSATSRCGSADVLEALGVDVQLAPQDAARAVDEVGIGFLFASAWHGAMRHAAGPRRELGVPTVFNMLGPLTNPLGAEFQLLGVASRRIQGLMAPALAALGTKRSVVVHGEGPLDEASPIGTTWVTEVVDGKITEYTLEPEDAGIERTTMRELRGGDPPTNAILLRNVLAGSTGPHRQAVLFNAALGLRAAGLELDLRLGVQRAAEVIDSGRAVGALESLAGFSRRLEARA